MGQEIERKFLVTQRRFLDGLRGERLIQAYLAETERAIVRVRMGEERAWLAVKSRTVGISRREFEYPIALAEAEYLIAELCTGPSICKTRYRVPFAQHIWDVDVFGGDNTGLVVAEVELGHEDERFERPEWLGEEVSHDQRYSNLKLSLRPYREWAAACLEFA